MALHAVQLGGEVADVRHFDLARPTPVAASAPSIAWRIIAGMDLPSLDQLRAKSVWEPPRM